MPVAQLYFLSYLLNYSTGTNVAAAGCGNRREAMNLGDLLAGLEQLTPEQYGYVGLAAVFGPLILRLFSFKLLANMIRPLALLVIVGGLYARQQRLGGSGGGGL